MFSLSNIKHHCRTCLEKLESANDTDNTKKCIAIRNYPNIEQLMRLCLVTKACDMEDVDCLAIYVPNLCRMCFKKWHNFEKLYKLAVESETKLRQMLEREISGIHCVEKHLEVEMANEVFIDAAEDLNKIEKYDTTSPFYQRSRSNTPNLDEAQNVCYDNTIDRTTPSENNEMSPPPTPKSIDSSYEHIPLDDLKGTTVNSKKTKVKNKKCTSLRARRKERSTVNLSKLPVDNDLNPKAKTSTKKAHYRCVPCKKYFYEIRKYEAHVKAVHEGAKKPFQCKQCDKAYKFHKTLIDHISLNHSDKPLETYKCKICNNLFKTHVTLKTHIQNKHRDSDAESLRVICDQCGFLAVNHISLKKHIKNRHTEAEELQCDECPKVFKNQYYLKYHKMNFHNPMNIKPFQCDDCDMAFTRQSLLNTHKRSHLDIAERIKCEFEGCEVRFLQQAEKRRHMRLVHLKVKQYVCDICGAAFGTKPTLRHHRYIHTNEKPYTCSVCGQGFRQRSAMKTHGKIHVVKPGGAAKNVERSLGTISTEMNFCVGNN